MKCTFVHCMQNQLNDSLMNFLKSFKTNMGSLRNILAVFLKNKNYVLYSNTWFYKVHVDFFVTTFSNILK